MHKARPQLVAALAWLALALAAHTDAQLPPAFLDEPYRPQVHFTPPINWTNDPNGAVYYQGEYHLFYQYNPFGDQWGHMTWGHAVSPDLLHWQHLPPAIPEENDVMIFSGSVVVDWHNSSGFCKSQTPKDTSCLVAIYTGHTEHDAKRGGKPLQTQNLAYSNDRGRTWTKYSGNPVIDLHLSDFRDPKVFWHEPTKRWVMVVSLPDQHKLRLYGSPDLKQWEQLSEFGPAGSIVGFWECPDLFELPVGDPLDRPAGGAVEKRWVLSVNVNPGAPAGGSGNQYFVGTFDGKIFSSDNPPSQVLWADYGKDFYASTSFSDVPEGRRIWLAWMSNWDYAREVPTSPWRGGMTIPRELWLRRTPAGLRLVQAPVAEVQRLEDDPFTMNYGSAPEVTRALGKLKLGDSYELEMDVMLPKGKVAGLRVLSGDDETFSVSLLRSASKPEITAQVSRALPDAMQAGQTDRARQNVNLPGSNEAHLRVLVDRGSAEVFLDHGRVALTNLIFPSGGEPHLQLFAEGPGFHVNYLRLWRLKSAVRYGTSH